MRANGEPSRTAFAAARHRAVHQVVERGRIFNDPLAIPLLGLDEAALRAEAAEHPEQRRMRFFVNARSRYAEDLAARAYENGVHQAVVLGAGLDTFAYRNEDPDRLVVEVDHPATQRWKRQRLEAAAIPTGSVRYVPVDFEREELLPALEAGGVALDAATLFLWLGVTPYLSATGIGATLSALGSLPHVGVVLDHASPVAEPAEARRAADLAQRASVAAIGEPWLSDFTATQLAVLLREHGFTDVVPQHELEVIELASGGAPSRPSTPSHLLFASRGWPRSEHDHTPT